VKYFTFDVSHLTFSLSRLSSHISRLTQQARSLIITYLYQNEYASASPFFED